MDDTRLGAILLESRAIGEADLEKCLEIQSLTGHSRPLGQILIEQGLIDRQMLERLLQLQQTRRTAQRSALTFDASLPDGYLRAALAAGARELVISEGRPVLARAGAEWRALTTETVRGPEVWEFVREEMGNEVLENLADRHFVVRDLHKPGVCRGRITAMRHFDGVAVFVELHPEKVMTAVELGLPQPFVDTVRGGRGLVLLIGERGVGRTETLSGMLGVIADDATRYIVVLDDAIAGELPPGAAMVARRRVGEHVAGYGAALRTAIREDPDAIVVGSLSHPETFDMALRAAEGGRLVIGWLDETSVVGALHRIINFYPSYDVPRVRATLASVLRGICVRHLLPAANGGGLEPATELLLVDDAARELLRAGELDHLTLLMRAESGANGHSLDQCMFDLVVRGLVRIEDAYTRAEEKSWLLERSRHVAEKKEA